MAIFRRTPRQPVTSDAAKHVTIGSVHLDALRGGSALLVFLNHTRALYFASALTAYDAVSAGLAQKSNALGTQYAAGGDPGVYELLHTRISFASEAVVIFFVLSGYLVGGSVLRSVRSSRWSWKTYLAKRLTRIYMVLLPALILGVALDKIGLHHAAAGSVYFTPPGIPLVTTFHLPERLSAATILGNLLCVQGILVEYVGTNASIWSLCNEVWYYLTFPFLALAAVRTTNPWLRAGCVVAAAALIWFTGLKVALQFPLWILGALLVLVPQRLTEQQARRGAIVGFAVFLVAMVGVRLLPCNALTADYVVGSATCVLLYFGVQQRAHASEGVYKHVANFTSKISYSLYLFHLPMAVFLCAWLNDPWRPWKATGPHLSVFLAADAFIFGCVYLLWRVFEANTDAVRRRLFGY